MKVQNTEEKLLIPKQKVSTWTVIKDIAKNVDQEEAYYVCSLDEIIERHKMWLTCFPRVVPYYAVKCNDDITVLQLLAALGTCFDCASKAEIRKVLSIGISTDRIIFANPAKPISHIRYAAEAGISTMTFDNESELHKIHSIYPTAKLVLRIRVDAKEAQCPLGMKFGCDPIKEAPQLLQVAKALNLNVVGVSFHVGSGCREPEVFRRAISKAREIFTFSETLGYNFSILDIGGGYPGARGSSIKEIGDIVNHTLDEFFHDLDVRFIAEPGRFYVTSAYTLTCNIHSLRKITQEDEQGNIYETHRMYYINDGVYGSFNCILYDHQAVNPVPLKEYHNTIRLSSSLWGPTCDGLDQVIEDMLLPVMDIGDWIAFEDMGAYTLPVASPFNGFPVPKVFYIISQDKWYSFKKDLTLSGSDIRIVDGRVTGKSNFCLHKTCSELTGTSSSVEPISFAGITPEDLTCGY